MFRTLLLSAAGAGLAVGLLVAGLQHALTVPLIAEAEIFEAEASDAAALRHESHDDGHEHVAPDGAAPDAEVGALIERSLLTTVSSIVLGVGGALILLAGMVIAGVRITGAAGLAWGIGCYAALALAPALGLPPELPGSAAADLADRQIWWAATALSTSAGLFIAAQFRNLPAFAAAACLIAAPHLIGAPHPTVYSSTAPAELAGHFAAASLIVSAVFWVLLGWASAALFAWLAPAGPDRASR